jgi:hypothetical protein
VGGESFEVGGEVGEEVGVEFAEAVGGCFEVEDDAEAADEGEPVGQGCAEEFLEEVGADAAGDED